MERILWKAAKLNYTIGFQTLFNDAELAVADFERLAVVGRNGAGKSTLLKIIAGTCENFSGEIQIARNIHISIMPQTDEQCLSKTAEEVVAEGLARFYKALKTAETAHVNTPEFAAAEHLLSLHDAWEPNIKLDRIISKNGLDRIRKQKCSTLSGGELRKILLSRAVIAEPDLLLLDEPTNHLDIEGIANMEEYLASFRGACVFVTHDRYFLDRLATRIIELDGGKCYSCDGSYADFLAAKEEREYAEDKEEARRKSFLRREIEWVRRSPKARLKRNEGRLKRYNEIAAIQAPERAKDVELVIPRADYLGNKVVQMKGVTYQAGSRYLLKDFTFEFQAGQKIGVIGANGAGKTTLLNLICGKLAPHDGKVETAQTVKFNYIEQEHVQIDPEKTVIDEIGAGGQTVNLGGETIGIRAYLKRFLFTDERINTQIRLLSGGERARLVLAKILRGGGNFLILDEPTNDLDLPTLRVLEEALADYDGCLVTVSHDRYFLNRICTHIMAFEDNAPVFCDYGDYDSYEEKRALRMAEKTKAEVPAKKAVPQKQPQKPVKIKLSWNEERELETMESRALETEERINEIEKMFADAGFFAKNADEQKNLRLEYDAKKEELEKLYERWDVLECKKQGIIKNE